MKSINPNGVGPTLKQTLPFGVGIDAADIDVSKASNTACQVDLAAQGDGQAAQITGIYWSYNAAPTGGRLYIQEGSTTIFDVDITAAGPGYLLFQPALEVDLNTDAKVNLAGGGSGVTGKLNVRAHVIA